MRQEFNRRGYARLASSGQLRTVTQWERQVPDWKCISRGLQPGTLSQRVAYYRGSVMVASVHQYLQPNGTLGAGRIPDPKELLVDGVIWVLEDP